LGTNGVTVAVGNFVGFVVGMAVSRTLVADGVNVASTVAGAGAQPVKAQSMVISKNGIADMRIREELPGFMILSLLP